MQGIQFLKVQIIIRGERRSPTRRRLSSSRRFLFNRRLLLRGQTSVRRGGRRSLVLRRILSQLVELQVVFLGVLLGTALRDRVACAKGRERVQTRVLVRMACQLLVPLEGVVEVSV